MHRCCASLACWRLAKIVNRSQVVVIRGFVRHGKVSAKTIVTHALMQSP